MSRYAITILIIQVYSTLAIGQDNGTCFFPSFKPDTSNSECRYQILKANKDFNSGQYVIELQTPVPKSKSQAKVLLELYSINSNYSKFCVFNCYQYQLQANLLNLYGYDILIKSKQIADSLDKHRIGYSSAELKDYSSLSQYFKAEMPQILYHKLKTRYNDSLMYVNIDIDIEGRCHVKSIFSNVQTTLALKYIPVFIDGKVLFDPKLEDGKPVPTSVGLSLRFE